MAGLSADEFADLPIEPGWLTELDRGRVVRIPLFTGPLREWVIKNLSRRLGEHIYYAERLGGLMYEPLGYRVTKPGEREDTVWMPALVGDRHGTRACHSGVAAAQTLPGCGA